MIERPEEPQSDPAKDDEGEADKRTGKDEVEEQSEESFPASDPPSY